MADENVVLDDGSPPGHIEKMLGKNREHDENNDENANAGNETQVAQRPDNVPEKFWDAEKGVVNTDALLKAQADGEAALRKSQSGDEGEGAGDEAEVKDDNADKLSQAQGQVNTLRNTATTEFNETGDVSEETRNAIVQTGLYSREDVDTFIAGQKAIVGGLRTAAYSPFGDGDEGKTGYESAANWAAQNMSQDEIRALDVQLTSTNPAIVKEGAKALLTRYAAEADYEPPALRGNNNGGPSGDVYRGRDEMMRDMRDPRYRTSAAFREEVKQKLKRSKL